MFLCTLCEEPIDPDAPSTRQRVIGWQVKGVYRPSGQRGGSDIEAREVLQAWAHPWCVSKVKNGVSPHQESLV